MVAEQQACFSEFCFAPCTGLGSEWVQLRLEGSWSGALLGGYDKVTKADQLPGATGETNNAKPRDFPSE